MSNYQQQEVLMQDLGVDKVFVDRTSGKNTDRAELKKLLDYVREGDIVIVESISRFARNTRELLQMVNLLREKQVEFVSRKESIDTTTPEGKFILTVFGAIAELERDYILQCQAEGIVIAKQAGKYKGRKKIEVDTNKFESVYRTWKNDEITAVKAMSRLNLNKATLLPRRKGRRAGGYAFVSRQPRMAAAECGRYRGRLHHFSNYSRARFRSAEAQD